MYILNSLFVIDFTSINSNICFEYEEIHFSVFGLRSICRGICVSILNKISTKKERKFLYNFLASSYQPCKCSRRIERKLGRIFDFVSINTLLFNFGYSFIKNIQLIISDSSLKKVNLSSSKCIFFIVWFSIPKSNNSICSIPFTEPKNYQS